MLSSSSYMYPFQFDISGKFLGKLSGKHLCQLNWPPAPSQNLASNKFQTRPDFGAEAVVSAWSVNSIVKSNATKADVIKLHWVVDNFFSFKALGHAFNQVNHWAGPAKENLCWWWARKRKSPQGDEWRSVNRHRQLLSVNLRAVW